MGNLTYRSGVLALSLTLAGCGDDGLASTEAGSTTGTGGQDTTTGKPTTVDPTVDPTVPTTTVTPTTTVDPDTTATVTVTDPTSDTDPVTATDTDPTVTATDTDGGTDTTTGTVGDTTTTGTTGTTADTDSSSGTTGEPVACGDGKIDPGEGCDDGKDNGDDKACKADCTPNVCGDGFLGPDEACDDGDQNGDDKACKADCTPNVCGDGALGPGEECDDGANNGDNNACKADCTPNVCGDGLVGPGEGCDDGNNMDNDACTNACAVATCGDGIESVSEECDDGNDVDTDLCTGACTAAACGDGFTQAVAGEGCDDGANNGDQADCTSSCNPATCGDGLIHNLGLGTEECDNAGNNGPGQLCNAMCKLNVCGDGDQGPGEGCDDGDLDNGDGCDQNCKLEVCGDSKKDANEDCDDGQNGNQDDGCTDQCLLPKCGDSFEQPSIGEQCDLGGNNSNTGDCTLLCKDAACGDSLIHAGVEQCDDGPNNGNTKACKADCSDNFCGDGFVEAGIEECDDGNAVDNDACSNVCKKALCNDTIKNNGETEVDCGGPNCGLCPTVIMLASGNTGPNGNRGGTFTNGTGWNVTPLAGLSVEGTDVTMTTANLGVGVLRFTQMNNPADNRVQYVTWTNGAWSQPQSILDFTTFSQPSIDAATTTAQMAFLGTDSNIYYSAFTNGNWSAAQMSGSTSNTNLPPDLVALGDNAHLFFMDKANVNRISWRERVNGMWGAANPITQVNPIWGPIVIRMTAGTADLYGLWPLLNGVNQIRSSFRVTNVYQAGITLTGTTLNRIAATALPFGSVAIVYRGVDNKFHSIGYNALLNKFTAVVDMPGAPDITGTPGVAPGVNGADVETVFISNGQVFHSRFSQMTNAWSNPVLVPGTADIRGVSLARSK